MIDPTRESYDCWILDGPGGPHDDQEQPMPKQTPAQQLAALLLDYDHDYPGDEDVSIEIDPETWLEMIDLAGQIEMEDDQ